METSMPTLNDFLLERELGQNEESTFYHGIVKKTHQKVLIKLLNPTHNTEPEIVQAFIEEAKAIRDMNYPGVIQLVDFGQESGFFFTAYERPVVTLLDRLPQLTLSECIDLFQEIVKALDFMHIQGYVHGHLTPGSIMFREDGSLAIMNLGTFILQSYQTPSFDSSKVSPAAYYKSPEQCRNQPIDSRSDHYSLGAILYHMLSKKPPYPAENTVGVIVKHVEAPPPQLEAEHARYQPLLDKMMAKDPFNRTQNGKEILEWLGSGASAGAYQETLELDFNPDIDGAKQDRPGFETKYSPYAQEKKTPGSALKLILPAALLLLVAVYFLFMKESSSQNDQSDQEAIHASGKAQKGRGSESARGGSAQTPLEKKIQEIESAISQGELSLAEAKINELSESPSSQKEVQRLKGLLDEKNQENKKQQYDVQLAIAEAALNSDDLPLAEKALLKARSILTGPELLRLETLLQRKLTAPEEEKVSGDDMLLPDPAEDDRAFQRARITRSREKIIEYLNNFPNGRHKEEANLMLQGTKRGDQTPETEKIKTQKTDVSMTLSSKPSALDEATVTRILETTDFFDARRNPNGSFDNTLRPIKLAGKRGFLDTGLRRIWLSEEFGKSLTVSEAKAWIEQLNKNQVGGYSDWRMPTLAEAASLLRPKKTRGGLFSVSFFDLPEWVWSADRFDGDYSWAVFFKTGTIEKYRNIDALSAIAVRTSENQ